MEIYVFAPLWYINLSNVPFINTLVVKTVALAEAVLKRLNQIVTIRGLRAHPESVLYFEFSFRDLKAWQDLGEVLFVLFQLWCRETTAPICAIHAERLNVEVYHIFY